MGYTRLLVYLVGLVVVVLAAWLFLTQTPVADVLPAGVALAIVLLLVGIGIMASARSINDARYSRRVHRDDLGRAGGAAYTRVYDTGAPRDVVVDRARVVDEPVSGDTIVEERRWD